MKSVLKKDLFRQLDNFNIFLAISEVVGYYDWLSREGKISVFEHQGQIFAQVRD